MVQPLFPKIIANFTGYYQYPIQLRGIANALPHIKQAFLREIGVGVTSGILRLYRSGLLGASSRPMLFSGSYGRSLAYALSPPTGGNMSVTIGFNDQSTSRRLPIYWRAMETGARPAAYDPVPIFAWSRLKAQMNPLFLYPTITRRGVRPQRLLSRFFVFSHSAQAMGITSQTRVILDVASYNMSRALGQAARHTQGRVGTVNLKAQIRKI